MSTKAPIIIEHSNLSIGWCHAFLQAVHTSARNLRPLVLTIGEFTESQPPEVGVLRESLDQHLSDLGKNTCAISALTIFPYKMWVRRGRPPCRTFSKLCTEQFLPRMQSLNGRNPYGTYFGRMMSFRGIRSDGPREINQLQFAIELLNKKKRPRESALQISCFDPAKDHTGQPVRGFPCLQQVGISYDDNGQLAINAFYPMQYMFDRAYGNYLGLCHLGEFVAHETKLRFSRLTCFIGKPQLGEVAKYKLKRLIEAAERVVAGSK